MRRPAWHLAAVVFAFILGSRTAEARPIEFSEVSLLVRAHESNSEIMEEVCARRLFRPLSAHEEDLLRSQGASDDLIRSLRDTRIVLSPSEANAFNAEQQRAASRRPTAREQHDEGDSLGGNVQVFDVSYDHPVNLSQWGGPDYEIAFRCRRYAGEDIIEPFLPDNDHNYVDTDTYLDQGRPDESSTVFDRGDYVPTAHESSHPLSIDTSNPVLIKGLPYVLYPVYNRGGFSLFYIGKSGGSVKLAVVTARL